VDRSQTQRYSIAGIASEPTDPAGMAMRWRADLASELGDVRGVN
jgi:hypothetical protein